MWSFSSFFRLLIAGELLLVSAPLVATAPVQVPQRERFDAERRDKARELVVAERAQSLAERDFELRREQANELGWTNPLVIALIIAGIAALGNAGVALVNGWQQRKLERDRSGASQTLERRKALAQRALEAQQSESDRILEVIRIGSDPDAAARNMQFLIDAGLVAKPALVGKLKQYLSTRKPGSGPVLPAVEGMFAFKRDADLTSAVQARLKATLDDFLAYLAKVGFSPESAMINIEVMRDDDQDAFSSFSSTNAFYDAEKKRLLIGVSVRDDPDVICHTYMEYILVTGIGYEPDDETCQRIMVGLADYYACSFKGRPELLEISAQAMDDGPYLRTLAAMTRYSNIPTEDMWQEVRVWGAMFWALRNALDQTVADRILCAAWKQADWKPGRDAAALAMLNAIWGQLSDDDARDAVRAVFVRAHFPLPDAARPSGSAAPASPRS